MVNNINIARFKLRLYFWILSRREIVKSLLFKGDKNIIWSLKFILCEGDIYWFWYWFLYHRLNSTKKVLLTFLSIIVFPSTHTTLFWHPYDVVLTLWTLYGHRNDVVCLLGWLFKIYETIIWILIYWSIRFL